MDKDLGRYSSAAGWQPKDPWKKQRDKASEEEEKKLQPEDSMLELRTANEWMEPESEPPAHLFGNLWRTGELAVLLGEPQIGKSLLAVQIADELTTVTRDKGQVTSEGVCSAGSPPYEGGVATLRGQGGSPSRTSSDKELEEVTRDEGQKEVTSDEGRGTSQSREFLHSSHSSLVTRPSSLEKVLYIDLQRTAAQWTERYSCRTPTLGKFVMPYEFPENFERAGVNWEDVDHVKFKRDPIAFVMHSIYHKIEDSNAKIVIIDDLTLGGVVHLRKNATPQIIQTLKFWTITKKLSILVISTLSRIPIHLSVADSIFSLNRSTFGPQYRYIKSLKRSAISDEPTDEVQAYELASSTPLLPYSSTPALPIFLKDLGPTREFDHHIDYTAETERILREQRDSLQSARAQLPGDFIDIQVRKALKD